MRKMGRKSLKGDEKILPGWGLKRGERKVEMVEVAEKEKNQRGNIKNIEKSA